MAGAGLRFARDGYTQPKPLVPVAGRPMLARVLETLPRYARRVAVARAEHARLAALAEALLADGQAWDLLPLEQPTDGQARTCLLAGDRLDPDAPLLIAPCDAALVYDEAGFAALAADPAVDAVVWTFRNHPHANRYPRQYGWVRANAAGQVEAVACKQPWHDDVRGDPGVIGAFWFRRARFFFEAAEALIAQDRRVNGEFYVDSAMQVLVEHGRRVRLFDVRQYVCLGTPDDVRTFEYWEGYFHRSERHPYRRAGSDG
jgi:CTP:molybdopterin cytidylyltransferase MocA